MSALERKLVALGDLACEAKAEDSSDGEMRFKGYGAVFGNRDSYDDVIEKGAFAATLALAEKTGQYPAMLLQHGGGGLFGGNAMDSTPIGVWAELSEDSKGLKVEGVLAPTARGTDVYTLMKMKPRPAITGLSIGYIARKYTIGTKKGEPRRVLHEIDLMEISPVTFPANGKARVTGVKSVGGGLLTEREFEQLLQDAGLSRSESRVVVTQGYKSLLTMQDAGSAELKSLADIIRRNATILQP
jgi:HK97 family phage prohead protease